MRKLRTCYFAAKLITLSCLIVTCSPQGKFDPNYYHLVKKAEQHIIKHELSDAISTYDKAFKLHSVPFGKDIYNAALVAFETGQKQKGIQYCKYIIDRSPSPDKLYQAVVPRYINDSIWNQWILSRQVEYNNNLLKRLDEITLKDQMFRPLYEVYDDTINYLRKENLKEILKLSTRSGLPAQMELGYSDDLQGHSYHVVLHHTAQRKGYDSTVTDLTPILYRAVNSGRIDPEQAIYFLNFQNNPLDGPFINYSTKQIIHKGLPDSLQSTILFPTISNRLRVKGDSVRNQWRADALSSIEQKVIFSNNSDVPYLFSSVKHSIIELDKSLSPEEAFEQYQLFTTLGGQF